MLGVIEFIVFIGFIWSFAFWRSDIKVWSPVLILALVGLTLWGDLYQWLLVVLWLTIAVPAIIFNIPQLRRLFISKPILNYFRRILPPISATEKQAINAGDVWWDGELFTGNPNWKELLNFPKPSLTDEEQAFLDHQVEALCHMVDDWKIVQEDKDLPKEVWDFLKQERFLGMGIPKEYGGLEFSALAHSSIIQKIASKSVSAAVTSMVPNSLGPAELILKYGTEEQKNYYLPKLAVGEEIPCFALTAPDAGSDASALVDNGIICMQDFDGAQTLGIKLNFNKRYITLAPIATVISLAVKLYDPKHLLGEKTDLGISVALVPTDLPGIEIGKRHLPMNLGFMNGSIYGEDVFIPLDWIVGGEKMVGHGWRMLMDCLAEGRAISMPALSTSVVKLCYRTTGAYARVRQQFHTSIGYFEGVEEALAKIAGYTYMIEATCLLTANAVNQHIKPSIPSAIAKYQMTELGRDVVNHAMDIHAGRSIQYGPRNYLAHLFQSIPMSITVEGANILTRNLMIFGQGAVRCHPYLRKEMQAAQDENVYQGLLQFDNLLFSHISYFVRNSARTLWYGVSNATFNKAPCFGPVAKYYKQLTRMSAALAFVTDVSFLLLGGSLKRKERLSARLADVLSQLYIASAILKYYQDNGAQRDDFAYVAWGLKTCLNDIQNAFYEYFANFPNRFVAKLLRIWIFPWGRSYHRPKDTLEKKLVSHMLVPNALRDRLTKNIHLSGDPNEAVYRMEYALEKLIAAQAIDKKLQQAMRAGRLPRNANMDEQLQAALQANILTQEEVTLFSEAQKAIEDAIQVDEFLPEYFSRKSKRKTSRKQKPPVKHIQEVYVDSERLN